MLGLEWSCTRGLRTTRPTTFGLEGLSQSNIVNLASMYVNIYIIPKNIANAIKVSPN